MRADARRLVVRATGSRYDGAVFAHAAALVLVALPRGLAVEWAAPPECPSAASVRAQIEDALVDAPAGPRRGVHGRLTRLAELGWRLEISVHEGSEAAAQPPIEAGDCGDLAAEFVSRTQTLWTLWTRPRPAPPPRKVAGRVRVAGHYGHGLLKEVHSGGGQVVFALAWRRARIEAGLAADGARVVLRDGDTAVRSQWLRASVLLRGCGEVVTRAVDVHLCAGLAVGPMGGRNAETGTQRGARATLDLHAAPAITWWFHRVVGLYVGLGAGVFVLRPTPIAHESGQELRDPSPYKLEAGVGLEFRWDR